MEKCEVAHSSFFFAINPFNEQINDFFTHPKEQLLASNYEGHLGLTFLLDLNKSSNIDNRNKIMAFATSVTPH